MEDHAAMLERYRQTQTGSGWHTAPDDGYVYNHLAVLLKETGQIHELKGLFANSDWMQVRVQQGSYEGFLADLNIAWEIAFQKAEEQIEAGSEPDAFLDCLHYVLIEASLRSRAENLTAAIPARAVEVGMWTAQRALSLAALIPDEQRRADMYAALARTEKLTAEQAAEANTEALEAAETIDFPWSRASALSMLSDQTQDEQQSQALSSALEAALQAAEGTFGSNGPALWLLIPKLPTDLLEQALSGVLALHNSEARAWALSALTKRLPEEQHHTLLEQGLNAALEVKQDVNIANALAQLADQLSGELVTQALDGALALKEGNWRPRAIAGLMDKLDAEQVERVLESMLTIEDEWWRADGLRLVVEHVAGEMRRRALTVLLRGQHGETFAKIQSWLQYADSIELLEMALEVAKGLDNVEHRIRWQFTLEAFLSQKRKEAEITSLPDLIAQVEAFLVEAESAKAKGETPQFLNAFMTIWKIEDEAVRDQFMNRIKTISGEASPREQWASSEELDRVLQEQYEEERSQGLKHIGNRLPDNLLPRALEAAFAFKETLYRDWAFEGLAARLNGELLQRALEAGFPYEDKSAKFYAFNSLAKNLEEPVKSEVLMYAVDGILAVQQPYWCAERLIQMMPALQGKLAAQAAARLFQLAQIMSDDEMRLHALAAAIEHLTGELRQEALTIVLDNLWTYQDRSQVVSSIYKPGDPMLETNRQLAIWQRMRIIGCVLKHLEGEQKATILTRALDLTLGLKDVSWFSSSLRELARYLEGDLLKQAFEAAVNLRDERQRVEAVSSLIDRLSPEDLLHLVEIAAMIEQPDQRASLLIAVARRYDGEPKNAIMSQAYEAALLEPHHSTRFHLLIQLAELSWTQAATQAMELTESWDTTRENAQYLAKLAEEGLEESIIRLVERTQSRNAAWEHTLMIVNLLPFVQNQADLLRSIRRGMLAKLRDLRREKRESVLYFCADNTVLTPPMLSQRQLVMLSTDLVHICRDWRWP